MEKQVCDASFKRMAIDLSYARGSVKEVADVKLLHLTGGLFLGSHILLV